MSEHGLPRTDAVRPVPHWFLDHNRWWARRVIRSRYRVELHGTEHVPRTGPVILAANHVGVIDGPLLAIFGPRSVHALTKIEMFQGFLGRLLRQSGQIPLDRFHTDPRAVKLAIRLLREDRAIGIFPEGARGAGELDVFHRGAAYLALVTGAPIVPVVMLGTREPGGSSSSLPAKGCTLHITYGAPFPVQAHPWPRTRQQVAETSRLLRARMLAEIDAAQERTGRRLPGPLPVGQHEQEPGGGITGADGVRSA